MSSSTTAPTIVPRCSPTAISTSSLSPITALFTTINQKHDFSKKCSRFCEHLIFIVSLPQMIVTFVQPYLQELYVTGQSSDKKHRYQPQIVTKYVKVINLMKQVENVLGLAKYRSLHYEKLHGHKEGISSVRVNDQYRIEFTEGMEDGKHIATICNIIELSNHYK